MISVGSIDGRQLSGLGLEMEGNDLEEGEAGYFQNDGDDSTIDPDIALSYIGEKLQNVLGHFQKDFEGGVSAENLGAKFGGYGSFLPTYQRSPSWSRLRSSPEVHNYSGPRFPNNPHSEDGRENSFASTSASLSARPGASSGKTATMHDSVKRDVSTPSTHAEELTSNVDLVKKSGNPSERRTLKVRIKVGAENLSTRQNAEIYSGLGLDVSPSSSLDDNPIVSEGLCGNNQDLPEEPDESPTSILQIMTSFPAHGSLLLSPLSDDLIRLLEKGKLNGESESKLMHNENLESSGMLFSGSLSRNNQKVLTQKKWKSSEKDRAFPTPLINEKNNDSLLKKETDTDVLGCEELVSNALKLPLLLSSQHVVGDPTKDISKEVDISAKDGVKDKTCSGLIKKEILGSEFAQHTDRVEKYDEDLHPPDKVWESKKANFGIDSAACPQEDGHKSEKARFESNFFKGRKAPGAEATNPSKQSAVQKEASSNEDGVKLTPGKEMLSSGSRKKSKGVRSGGSQGSDVSKDQLMLDSSLMPKNRKSSLSNNLMSKNDSLDFKRNPGKPGDRYKDFFGDLELEEEDSESISGEVRSPRRHKDSQLVIKRSIAEGHGTLKEKNDVKKFIKPSPYSAVASSMDPKTLRGPTSDANLAGVDPLDQEDWVQCDRCQQWRLLPLGTNPQILPDKWRCRMLTWLPGMNHCSIPEEQTTKALRALNHLAPASALAPASESHQNLLNYPAGTLLEVSSVTAKCLGREQQNIGSKDINMINGKKKHGSMDMTNSSDLDDPTHFLDSQKNDVKVSGKNELNYSPSVDAYQHLRHSSSVVGEKRKDIYNKKEKKSSLDGHSDRGTNSKVKNKREPDSESFRISKKVKSENVHFGDENWTSDNGGDSSKAGRSSSSGLLNNAAETDQRKYANPKDSRGDAKKSAKNPETNKPGTSDDGLLCMTKYDHHDSVKKRKGNEHHDLPSAERHPKDREAFVEETHESNHGKEKKTRIFKSEGKDTSRSTGNVGMDKNGRSMKDQLIDNAADYLKSSMGSLQPSVAANSSSSKVSGSCKNKPSVHEMKGSPVESVSSSPFRYPDADKFSSAGRNPVHKDEFQDSEAFTMARPGRVWGGEDNGGDERPGTVIKDANHNVTNHDSLESHALEFSNRDLSQASDGKVKAESLNCRDVGTEHATNVFVDCLGQGNEECQDEERTNTQNSGHQTKKSGKGYSSRSKDKNHNSRLDIDKGKNKISDSSLEFVDHLHSHEEKLKSKRNKCDEKFVTPDKVDKIFISKNDSAEGILSDSGKGESQLKFGGHNGSDVTKGHDKKQKVQWDYNDEKSSQKIISGTSDRVGFESNGRGKSHSLPPLSRGQAETQASMSGSKNENEEKISAIDAFENGDASKAHRQGKKAEKSGSQPFRTRHSTPEVHKGRDLEAPSPNRRDSSSHAATNAVKEAKALKHMADRKKSSGSTESTGLYFQAALKFLHGASLLESGNNERTKHNETIQSTQMYSSTAKLCEFCAHEYEKLKDMAAAALAYKCMEVAYMKVIYSSHTSASRDRNELQNVLQIVPPGESPSSSASDVDNLNNQSIVDKAALAKGVSSPQVAGSHVIPPRNRSSFTRLLNYAQDVSFAMEASRKSRIAFTAANPRLGETQLREGISAVKKALDFNFQDVDGLLRLVRVAMEAISH